MQSPESPAERVHEPLVRWYLHLKHAARPHTCDDANFCFGSLERFRAKWIPVRVKKTRQNKNLEPRSDSIGTEKALALDITGCHVKTDARGMDIGITTVGPIDEARHRVQQGLA